MTAAPLGVCGAHGVVTAAAAAEARNLAIATAATAAVSPGIVYVVANKARDAAKRTAATARSLSAKTTAAQEERTAASKYDRQHKATTEPACHCAASNEEEAAAAAPATFKRVSPDAVAAPRHDHAASHAHSPCTASATAATVQFRDSGEVASTSPGISAAVDATVKMLTVLVQVSNTVERIPTCRSSRRTNNSCCSCSYNTRKDSGSVTSSASCEGNYQSLGRCQPCARSAVSVAQSAAAACENCTLSSSVCLRTLHGYSNPSERCLVFLSLLCLLLLAAPSALPVMSVLVFKRLLPLLPFEGQATAAAAAVWVCGVVPTHGLRVLLLSQAPLFTLSSSAAAPRQLLPSLPTRAHGTSNLQKKSRNDSHCTLSISSGCPVNQVSKRSNINNISNFTSDARGVPAGEKSFFRSSGTHQTYHRQMPSLQRSPAALLPSQSLRKEQNNERNNSNTGSSQGRESDSTSVGSNSNNALGQWQPSSTNGATYNSGGGATVANKVGLSTVHGTSEKAKSKSISSSSSGGVELRTEAIIDLAVGAATAHAVVQLQQLRKQLQRFPEQLPRLWPQWKEASATTDGNITGREGLQTAELPLTPARSAAILADATHIYRAAAAAAQQQYGEAATALIQQGQSRLEAILDSALQGLFQQQMAALLLHTVQVYQRQVYTTAAKAGGVDQRPQQEVESPDPGLQKGDQEGHADEDAAAAAVRAAQTARIVFEELLQRAATTEQQQRWGASALRRQLGVLILQELQKREEQEQQHRESERRHQQEQQTLLQVLQQQQHHLQQLQNALLQQQSRSPISFGAAYRVPDSNLQLAASARQGGRLQVQLSCVPDEMAAAGAAATVLGQHGFVRGIEAAGNLGVSLNFGI